MILINKNSVNKIALTLTEKSELLSYDNTNTLIGTSYNLFVFIGIKKNINIIKIKNNLYINYIILFLKRTLIDCP